MKKQILLAMIFLSSMACSGGSGSFGEPVPPDADFSTATDGVNMSIPANTFSSETSFEFSESKNVDTSDIPSTSTIQSSPFQLHFSNSLVVEADKEIVLTITLNKDAPNSDLFALIKSEGKRVNSGGDIPTAGTWRIAMGTQENGVFTLKLFATAERQSIVIVSNSAAANVVLQAKNVSPNKNMSVAKAVDAGLFERPWAIFCDRSKLSADICKQDIMGETAGKFKAVAAYLGALDVQVFNVTSNNFAALKRIHGQDFVFSSEADPEDKMHNFAIVTSTVHCEITALGCYDFETKTIYLTEQTFTDNVRDSTIAHELMHAVQHRAAPSAFRAPNALWITEGTAEYIAQGYGLGEGDLGVRIWTESLEKVIDLYTPYQTWRFFEAAFENAGFTYPFLLGTRGNTSYKLADAGFGSIGELFTVKFIQVMQDFYAQQKITCSENLTATDEEQTAKNFAFPMSTRCSSFVAKEDTMCVQIKPTFGDTELAIVNGSTLTSEKVYLSAGKKADYQLISFDTESSMDTHKNISMKYKQVECNPDLVGLWCATDYGPRHYNGECSTYSDYVRISKDNNNNFVATAFMFTCEGETHTPSVISESGNTVEFNYALGQGAYGCGARTFSYQLDHDRNILTGKYHASGIDAMSGPFDVEVTYIKRSSDPNARVGFVIGEWDL